MTTLLRVLLATAALTLGAPAAAGAAGWPVERIFTLASTSEMHGLYPPPAALAETADRTLLVVLLWTESQPTPDGTGTMYDQRTRLSRLAPDGTQTFVRPFGELKPGSDWERYTIEDEILPLADGSMLFGSYNAIDVHRPDGSIARFAGTGLYHESSSGDGGPALVARMSFPRGLARAADGSILFGDGNRVRRIAPDGIITTVAGRDGAGPGGDGGPATAAVLRSANDVLPTADGGFLIAEMYGGRVRRVGPDGVISTLAGSGKGDIFESSGDGGPAVAAQLSLPQHLAFLPDGSLLIGENKAVRRVAADGTISTLLQLPEGDERRMGDFVGRHADTVEALEVTEEGGIAVIVSGLRLRVLYLAPESTARTLVAVRAVRASQRKVGVTVRTSRPGRLRLEVSRRGKVVAKASRTVRAGRQAISAGGRFAAAFHDVRVTLTGAKGAAHNDEARVFTSRTLPERLVLPTLGSSIEHCDRITARRIDCEHHIEEDEEDGRNCLDTYAYRLFASGILFRRPYGTRCHRTSQPFDRTPEWTAPWSAWPWQ